MKRIGLLPVNRMPRFTGDRLESSIDPQGFGVSTRPAD
jgi:hypothetical protein